MSFETVFLPVFQNEEAVFFQQVVFEDKVGQSFQPGKFVGRIGKDKVELLPFGDMDQWVNREIKESGIIGGHTKNV